MGTNGKDTRAVVPNLRELSRNFVPPTADTHEALILAIEAGIERYLARLKDPKAVAWKEADAEERKEVVEGFLALLCEYGGLDPKYVTWEQLRQALKAESGRPRV